MAEQLDVVERVLQILDHGRYTSTYKLAVLVGLMDLCVEQTSELGWPPNTISTRQLAEKVLALYWGQVGPFDGGTLRQNRGKRGTILGEVSDLRARTAGASLATLRRSFHAEREAALRSIEWVLIKMPLPKLQRVGGQDTRWLYEIGWDDDQPKAPVSAYQRGDESDFDNRIWIRPEVAMAFVRLRGLLRPFVQERWAKEVANLNDLPKDRLHSFLFGADRASLERVRAPLHELQAGACFYCRSSVREASSHVDHFLPWSRHADDALANLVLAHKGCNLEKSDHLAAADHVERWRARLAHEATLSEVATATGWDSGAARTLGAARALYLRLPPNVRLWTKAREFEVADEGRLHGILA